MIRPIILGAEFCQDLKGETGKFAEAKGAEPPADPKEYKIMKVDTECGKEYFWERGGVQRCWGTKCSKPKENCGAATEEGKGFACVEGFPIIVSYTGGAYIASTLVDTNAEFWIICSTRQGVPPAKPHKLTGWKLSEPTNKQSGSQAFYLDWTAKDLYNKMAWNCGGDEFVEGFVFAFLVNQGGSADDWYMVGKANDKPISCETKVLGGLGGGGTTTNAYDCLQNITTSSWSEFVKSDLLSPDDFAIGKFPKRYFLSHTNFPNR